MTDALAYEQPAKQPIIGRKALIIGFSLAIMSIVLVFVSQRTGVGVLRMPITEIVSYRDLTFFERADGGFEVRDASDGSLVDSLALGKGGGFIQVIISGMMRDRTPKGVGRDAPYRLARHGDGRLILHDPATDRHQTVDTFGSVNRDVFVRLLSKGEKQ